MILFNLSHTCFQESARHLQSICKRNRGFPFYLTPGKVHEFYACNFISETCIHSFHSHGNVRSSVYPNLFSSECSIHLVSESPIHSSGECPIHSTGESPIHSTGSYPLHHISFIPIQKMLIFSVFSIPFVHIRSSSFIGCMAVHPSTLCSYDHNLSHRTTIHPLTVRA